MIFIQRLMLLVPCTMGSMVRVVADCLQFMKGYSFLHFIFFVLFLNFSIQNWAHGEELFGFSYKEAFSSYNAILIHRKHFHLLFVYCSLSIFFFHRVCFVQHQQFRVHFFYARIAELVAFFPSVCPLTAHINMKSTSLANKVEANEWIFIEWTESERV